MMYSALQAITIPSRSEEEVVVSTLDGEKDERGYSMRMPADMTTPILGMFQPTHQAMCRSAGPDLAHVFLSLVDSRAIPVYVRSAGFGAPLVSHHAPEEVSDPCPTVSSTTATNVSFDNVPIRLSRLPRPQSTVAYILDEDIVAQEEVLPDGTDSTPLTSSTGASSLCTSLVPMDVCVRLPAAAFQRPLSFPSHPSLACDVIMAEYPPLQIDESVGQSSHNRNEGGSREGDGGTGGSPTHDGDNLDAWPQADPHTSPTGVNLPPTKTGCSSMLGDFGGISLSTRMGLSSSSQGKSLFDSSGMMSSLFSLAVERKRLLQSHALSVAPASLDSSSIADASLVVNVEALALTGRSSCLVVTKARPRSRSTVRSVQILNGFCSNLNAKSVEFTGMETVGSVGNGFLAGSFIVTAVFGAMPRLKSVGDDWMYLCCLLRSVTFADDCSKLVSIGSYWLCECRSLTTFEHEAFPSVERVGSWWLARCDSLQTASFRRMGNLHTVDDWWMSSCAALEHVSFARMGSLVKVGRGWMYAAVNISNVSFAGLSSLRAVGDLWLSDCMRLQMVSHAGLGRLLDVGAHWLSGCCILGRVSMVGVNRLTSVGPYWLANTCAPHIECNSTNTSRISTLIDLSHDVLTQRGHIDLNTRVHITK